MVTGIQRSRLADQAYELLKERILTRQLLPGQRLSVPAIAQELELSRSPVREAVQRLVQEGLGTERPHSGAVVASADLPALVDLYLVRAELEGLAARLAVESGDDRLVTDLEAIQDGHDQAHADGARSRMIRADVEFHARVLRAAGNPELARMLEPVLQRMLLAMLEAERGWPLQAMAEHREFIAAVRTGDPVAARERMVEHVLRVRSDMEAKLRQERAEPAAPEGAS
ncbi:GntR family transcriptional regulator [Nocardioides sp. R1-1]|uniref:GntR family transcriptional regulator n=1 Tax=Nocardioides sp. R1-1 TaxID=3383502 RepID=UPI0038CF61AF